MTIPITLPKIDRQRSIVVDVTYLCNYTCNYCRWGSNDTLGREHHPLNYILADPSELEAIGVERVVLSGGEPLLHPDIFQIVRHYSRLVDDVILITNGWLADRDRIIALASEGLTGLAFSIDSIDATALVKTRDMTDSQVARSLENFQTISESRIGGIIDIELGVISVVTAENSTVDDVMQLLDWAQLHKLDYVKFNQIFDDGFAGMNAPNLLLGVQHATQLDMVAKHLENNPPIITTNIPIFWRTMAMTLRGARIDGASCGLRDRQAILYHGRYHFCAWINEPVLGEVGSTTLTSVQRGREGFSFASAECKTGPHCHCLQSISHEWKILG
ncbi:MAG: radical SAM protein [Gammaproteobacteria bacterium]|nr:radical SAM protein [Gammaproteobacteria bacterium]